MTEKKSEIPLIVLAAGSSSRLGQPKQFVALSGETLLERIVRESLASVCSPIIVVTGKSSALFRQNLDGFNIQIIENANWEQGMGTSISCGMKKIIENEKDSQGVVICVCDQPFVTAKIIDNLVKTFREKNSRIIASAYNGTLGVPALFDRNLFVELADLSGKSGAKKIIEKYRAETLAIEFPEGAIDIDTPEDLEKLRNRLN